MTKEEAIDRARRPSLREAAQQALEALEKTIVNPMRLDAITNLRAALAQQPEPAQEPVAWMVYTEDGKSVCVTDNPNDLVGAYRALPLYTTPPQRPAEPAQEPVAWECKAGGLKALTQRQYDAQTAATKRHYTRIAPPQRPKLTDEEIEDIFKHLCSTVGASYKTMARAIERKVRGE